jgi:hypothetical protein
MFHNIERANQIELSSKRGLLDVPLGQRAQRPRPRKREPFVEQIHAEHSTARACLLQGAEDVACSASHFQHAITVRPAVCHSLDQACDYLIACSEPEVLVLDLGEPREKAWIVGARSACPYRGLGSGKPIERGCAAR